MEGNIYQLFQRNPATDLQPNDLIYLGRAPYTSDKNMAVKWSTILNAIPGASAGKLPYQVITSASAQLEVNNGYFINRPSLVMLELPTTAQVGDIIEIITMGAGGWQVAQGNAQNIQLVNKTTTTGVAGYLKSGAVGDSIVLMCGVLNNFWFSKSVNGNITVF